MRAQIARRLSERKSDQPFKVFLFFIQSTPTEPFERATVHGRRARSDKRGSRNRDVRAPPLTFQSLRDAAGTPRGPCGLVAVKGRDGRGLEKKKELDHE